MAQNAYCKRMTNTYRQHQADKRPRASPIKATRGSAVPQRMPTIRSFALFLVGAITSCAFTPHAVPNTRYQHKVSFGRDDEVIAASHLALALSSSDGDASPPATADSITCSMRQHHMAMKTSNIEMSIAFYSLLDFYPVAKFRSGPARAAWLEHMANGDVRSEVGARSNSAARIELIEIPDEILYEGIDEEAKKQMPRKRALDRMANSAVLGWDHMCLDVSESIRTMSEDGGNDGNVRSNLQGWIDALNSNSQSKFGKDVRVALEPRVKVIGREQYELAFIYDADGGLIELVNKLDDSAPAAESSWDDEDDARIIWRNA